MTQSRDTFFEPLKSVMTWGVLLGVAIVFIMAPQVFIVVERAGLQPGFFMPAIYWYY
ncbi:hypothetical protein V466_27950 [Pseudomonas mandelii PD30]|uniref:Uncharacterized protein n=1 Tax=Pseudomonas mandelii PD30 TaxID=1419583 RepID=A0A059KUQ4_9PSED|nr:hypothetical protein V466_27950 [Pseudomonas mandelii PD30]